MRTAVLCVVLAMVSAPRPVGAQSTPLTEADALSRLSTDSPYVRAIRAGVDVARADVLSVRRWPNPRLMWDREAVGGVAEHIVTLAQPLPITGRRGLETQAAESLVSAASDRADDALRRARADLRLAFAQLLAAQRRQRALDVNIARLQELATVLTRREAAGDTAGFDRLRAEREVAELEGERGGVLADRLRAQAALAAFFAGEVSPASLQAAEAAPVTGALPEADALVDRAFRSRGDLLALQKTAEASRFAERAARRRLVPEPELVAGTKSSSAGTGDLGSIISLQASIPLFDRARPERALATARGQEATAREAMLRQVLRAEIAALHAEVQTRRATVTRYRDSAVRTSDAIARIAQVSYDAGERSILELLDALQTSSTAALREIDLTLAVRAAEIELEFISGWDLP